MYSLPSIPRDRLWIHDDPQDERTLLFHSHCVSLRLRSHFACYVGYYGLKCGWESVLFCRKKKNHLRFLLSESGKCWDSRLITCFPLFLFNAGLHIEFDKSGSFYQFITRHCGYRLGHISVLRDQICGLGSTCKGKCLRYYTVSLVNFLWSNESITWCNMRVVKAVLYCAESLQFSNGGGRMHHKTKLFRDFPQRRSM